MKLSLSEIALAVEGELKGDGNRTVSDAAPFELAAEEHITWAEGKNFLKRLHESRAGAVIVPKQFPEQNASIPLIFAENPRLAFAKAKKLFHPPREPEAFISPKAHVGEDFICGEQVHISHFVSIGDRVRMGNRVRIHPSAVIEDEVHIGDDTEICANVTIRSRCIIGSRVIINAGTVIGSEGFGLVPEGETYVRIPQTGIVQIDDDAEIGALNTIDRATFAKTWIQKGVKTDNLVHIAHNVTVGENTILVAQVGIAGSSKIGKHVILAGQSAVSDHAEIGDYAVIGPCSGVAKSVPKGAVVSGAPDMPHKLWLKVQKIIPRLPDLKKKISELEKRIQKIEEK